jgi:hypothetical protein
VGIEKGYNFFMVLIGCAVAIAVLMSVWMAPPLGGARRLTGVGIWVIFWSALVPAALFPLARITVWYPIHLKTTQVELDRHQAIWSASQPDRFNYLVQERFSYYVSRESVESAQDIERLFR